MASHKHELLFSCCVLLLLLTLHAASWVEVALASQVISLGAIDPTSPVSLQTRFRIDSKEALTASKGMWLVGFSQMPDTTPRALALVWSEITLGWFPTWGIQLQSNAGSLPDKISPKRGAGFLADSSYVSICSSPPEVGHTYQAELSYDSQTGEALVGLYDLTLDKRVTAKALTLQPITTPLYPVIAPSPGVEYEEFTTSSYMVPLDSPWDLRQKEGADFNRLLFMRINRNEELALYLPQDVRDFQGVFTLVADDGLNAKTLCGVKASTRDQAMLLPFSANELPFGDVVLRFSYVDEDGKVWLLGAKPLRVVAADLRISFGQLRIQQDVLIGSAEIQSQNGTAQDLMLRLYATFRKPGEQQGKRQLILEQQLDQVTKDPIVVSFAIPVDEANGLFSVTLETEFGIPVGLVTSGNQYYVLWQP